jgi:hypothetical protein
VLAAETTVQLAEPQDPNRSLLQDLDWLAAPDSVKLAATMLDAIATKMKDRGPERKRRRSVTRNKVGPAQELTTAPPPPGCVTTAIFGISPNHFVCQVAARCQHHFYKCNNSQTQEKLPGRGATSCTNVHQLAHRHKEYAPTATFAHVGVWTELNGTLDDGVSFFNRRLPALRSVYQPCAASTSPVQRLPALCNVYQPCAASMREFILVGRSPHRRSAPGYPSAFAFSPHSLLVPHSSPLSQYNDPAIMLSS